MTTNKPPKKSDLTDDSGAALPANSWPFGMGQQVVAGRRTGRTYRALHACIDECRRHGATIFYVTVSLAHTRYCLAMIDQLFNGVTISGARQTVDVVSSTGGPPGRIIFTSALRDQWRGQYDPDGGPSRIEIDHATHLPLSIADEVRYQNQRRAAWYAYAAKKKSETDNPPTA